MEQTKALNALAPFLALTKSASSPRAAASLITQATSAPNTFVFSELLSTPQIQSLSASEEFASHLTLLQIFSYGTYGDYISTPSLPDLNPAQTLKLRQLSFLTLARDPANLNYDTLTSKLGLGGSNTRELEDLVISTIYAGLIEGSLDPYNKRVLVSSVSPLRDVPPNSVTAMLDTLSEWSSRCTNTLSDIERQIAAIKADALRRAKEEREWNAHVEKLMEPKEGKEEGSKEAAAAKSGGMFSGLGKRLGGGGVGKRGSEDHEEEEAEMELDDEDEDMGEKRSTRSSKKRGFGFGK